MCTQAWATWEGNGRYRASRDAVSAFTFAWTSFTRFSRLILIPTSASACLPTCEQSDNRTDSSSRSD